jgi:hypothetical protein
MGPSKQLSNGLPQVTKKDGALLCRLFACEGSQRLLAKADEACRRDVHPSNFGRQVRVCERVRKLEQCSLQAESRQHDVRCSEHAIQIETRQTDSGEHLRGYAWQTAT